MMSLKGSVTLCACLLLSAQAVAVPEPSAYVLDFPTTDNPLNISVVQPLSKNYFITFGDWGAADGSGYENLQKAIASKMKSFYNSQKSKGMNLLAVLDVGDSFYWTGVDCNSLFTSHWADIYGSELTSVPWLSVYGNHDWGDTDSWSLCAWNDPNAWVDQTNQIPYGANQLNKDKRGCNPTTYYMPDFSYYYTIPELDFEFIAAEESSGDCGGLGGDSSGHQKLMQNCGSGGYNTGCDYLGRINKASEAMLVERATSSKMNNFIISNHYPSRMASLEGMFKRNGATVALISGHVHSQYCQKSEGGICTQIVTGGGGGCCSENSLRGFYVIGFDDNGKMTNPFAFNDAQISCQYPCGADMSKANDFYTCCHTQDDSSVDCTVFDLSQCKFLH